MSKIVVELSNQVLCFHLVLWLIWILGKAREGVFKIDLPFKRHSYKIEKKRHYYVELFGLTENIS